MDLARCGRGGGIGGSLGSLDEKSSGVAEGVISSLADRYSSGECSICCSSVGTSGSGAVGWSTFSVSSTSPLETAAREFTSGTSARESSSGVTGSVTGSGSAGCSTWRDQEKGQVIAR